MFYQLAYLSNNQYNHKSQFILPCVECQSLFTRLWRKISSTPYIAEYISVKLILGFLCSDRFLSTRHSAKIYVAAHLVLKITLQASAHVVSPKSEVYRGFILNQDLRIDLSRRGESGQHKTLASNLVHPVIELVSANTFLLALYVRRSSVYSISQE